MRRWFKRFITSAVSRCCYPLCRELANIWGFTLVLGGITTRELHHQYGQLRSCESGREPDLFRELVKSRTSDIEKHLVSVKDTIDRIGGPSNYYDIKLITIIYSQDQASVITTCGTGEAIHDVRAMIDGWDNLVKTMH